MQDPPEKEPTVKRGLLRGLVKEFSFVRGNFLILVLSWIIMDLASEMPATYYGLFVIELGGTASTIGFIAFVSMLASAFVQFPGGYLADKTGRKWIIAVMTLLAGLSYFVYAIAPSWQFILVGAVLRNLCSIYGPALTAIISDSVPPERRGMGYSIQTLIMSVSTTPSPIVAGWLLTRMGLIPSVRLGYSFVGVAYMVAGLLRLRLKETLEDPERVDRRELVSIYRQSISDCLGVWKLLPRTAFAMFLVSLIGVFASSLFQPIMVLWVVDDLGINEVAWSYIMTTLFVSMIVLSLPIGKIIDRYGKKRPLMVAYILWAAVMPLMIYGDFIRLLIAMPLVGVLQVALHASSSALIADLVPPEHRGKEAGSRGFFGLIAGACGQLLGGFLYDNVHHASPWVFQFLLVIPGLLLLTVYVHEPKKDIG